MKRFILVNDEVIDNCINYIKTEGKDQVVTIKDEKQTRSDAAKRLERHWCGVLAKELAGVGKGRNKEMWHLFFKHKFLRGLYIEQDEDYVPFFQDYDDICEQLPDPLRKEYQMQFWDKVVATENLHVKHFSTFLDQIHAYILDEYNYYLETPEDMKIARGQ